MLCGYPVAMRHSSTVHVVQLLKCTSELLLLFRHIFFTLPSLRTLDSCRTGSRQMRVPTACRRGCLMQGSTSIKKIYSCSASTIRKSPNSNTPPAASSHLLSSSDGLLASVWLDAHESLTWWEAHVGFRHLITKAGINVLFGGHLAGAFRQVSSPTIVASKKTWPPSVASQMFIASLFCWNLALLSTMHFVCCATPANCKVSSQHFRAFYGVYGVLWRFMVFYAILWRLMVFCGRFMVFYAVSGQFLAFWGF